MKRPFLLLFIVCMIGFPAITQAFEGIIVQKNTHVPSNVNPAMEAMEGILKQMPPEQRKMIEENMKAAMGERNPEVSTQTIYIKGPSLRVDMDQAEGENTFVVMDAKKKVMRTYFPDSQTYLEMTFDEIEEMGEGLFDMQKEMGAEGPAEKPGELKKTGEKKKINGYPCERYTQQVGDDINEYWITKEVTTKQIMGDFAQYMEALSKTGGLSVQQEALMKIDGYPIVTVTRDKYGTLESEVIKIEKKGLSNDLFAVPAGYQKQTMRDMMNQ